MTRTALVVGAGIAGITCALSLQARGWQVTLLDRDEPARHASRWNAGVMSTSSLIPLCAPGILSQLPRLLTGRHPGFRLNPAALASALPWGVGFLRRSRAPGLEHRITALHNLITTSRHGHEALMTRAGIIQDLRRDGWLHLFETEDAFARGAGQREIYARHEIETEVLDGDALAALEPHLANRFHRALWMRGSAFVSDPGALAMAYLAQFSGAGGTVRRGHAVALAGRGVQLDTGDEIQADATVIATGPWSGQLLKSAGLRLPMIAERGHVQRLVPRGNATLGRPVHDVVGGLVLSSRPDGIQVSTGTELTAVDVGSRSDFMNPWLARARQIFPLEEPLWETPHPCNRPTLPDSLPAIGPLAARPGTWLCTGHQHIGFMSAPGSADLLAAQIAGEEVPEWAAAFAPARFGL